MGTIEQIAKVHYAGLIDEFDAMMLPVKIDYGHLESMWKKRIWEGNKFVLMHHNKNGKVIGFLAIFNDEPMVYVDNSYRRRGIASCGGFVRRARSVASASTPRAS